MTTRRNNMFHDRGVTWGLTLADDLAKECSSIDELRERLSKIKDSVSKHIVDCNLDYESSVIESASVVTNHFIVTAIDGKYSLLKTMPTGLLSSRDLLLSTRYILWVDSTSTNYIVDVVGDSRCFDFIDNDNDFLDHITELIGCKDDYEVVDNPLHVEITDYMAHTAY